MGILGSVLVGALTALFGYPVYDGVFHPTNLVILICLCSLWHIIYIAIKDE